MSRKCKLTKKKPSTGYKYAIRGIAKKKKGIGLNITGKTKRRFLPNLFKKRIWNCFYNYIYHNMDWVSSNYLQHKVPRWENKRYAVYLLTRLFIISISYCSSYG